MLTLRIKLKDIWISKRATLCEAYRESQNISLHFYWKNVSSTGLSCVWVQAWKDRTALYPQFSPPTFAQVQGSDILLDLAPSTFTNSTILSAPPLFSQKTGNRDYA